MSRKKAKLSISTKKQNHKINNGKLNYCGLWIKNMIRIRCAPRLKWARNQRPEQFKQNWILISFAFMQHTLNMSFKWIHSPQNTQFNWSNQKTSNSNSCASKWNMINDSTEFTVVRGIFQYQLNWVCYAIGCYMSI